MKRKKIKQAAAKKLFTATAQNVKPVNNAPHPMRGGFRL